MWTPLLLIIIIITIITIITIIIIIIIRIRIRIIITSITIIITVTVTIIIIIIIMYHESSTLNTVIQIAHYWESILDWSPISLQTVTAALTFFLCSVTRSSTPEMHFSNVSLQIVTRPVSPEKKQSLTAFKEGRKKKSFI